MLLCSSPTTPAPTNRVSSTKLSTCSVAYVHRVCVIAVTPIVNGMLMSLRLEPQNLVS
jgi:hypothetical protein